MLAKLIVAGLGLWDLALIVRDLKFVDAHLWSDFVELVVEFLFALLI